MANVDDGAWKNAAPGGADAIPGGRGGRAAQEGAIPNIPGGGGGGGGGCQEEVEEGRGEGFIFNGSFFIMEFTK